MASSGVRWDRCCGGNRVRLQKIPHQCITNRLLRLVSTPHFPSEQAYGEMNLDRLGGVEKSLISSARLLPLGNGYLLHTKSIFAMKLLVPLPRHCHAASSFRRWRIEAHVDTFCCGASGRVLDIIQKLGEAV
jgi:hypothetical protein